MDINTFEPRTDLADLHGAVAAIRGEIEKVIVGQHQLVDLLMTGLLANGHILVEGVPGVAKTLAAKLLAGTIDAKFSRIQFTPDLIGRRTGNFHLQSPKQGVRIQERPRVREYHPDRRDQPRPG